MRQKLIDEPLVEHQEQYKEDPVQPTTREDAVALTKLLTTSLPLGSIQVWLTAAVACAKFASNVKCGVHAVQITQ